MMKNGQIIKIKAKMNEKARKWKNSGFFKKKGPIKGRKGKMDDKSRNSTIS
jgi:hypothetical protein